MGRSLPTRLAVGGLCALVVVQVVGVGHSGAAGGAANPSPSLTTAAQEGTAVAIVVENTGPSAFTEITLGFDVPPLDTGPSTVIDLHVGTDRQEGVGFFEVAGVRVSATHPLPPGGVACVDPTSLLVPGSTLEFDGVVAGTGGIGGASEGHPEVVPDVTVLTFDRAHDGVTGGRIAGVFRFPSAANSPCPVVGNRPPVVGALGSGAAEEGDTVVLAATMDDPDGDPLYPTWDFDGDGIFETPGTGRFDPPSGTVEVPTAGVDGPAALTAAAVRVCDGQWIGHQPLCSTAGGGIAQIANAPPAVLSLWVWPTSPSVTDTLTVAADFADGSVLDAHGASIDWGDGTTSVAVVAEGSRPGVATGSHQYVAAGAYTVTVTVTDDDGASGSDSVTVTVGAVPPTVDAGGDLAAAEGEAVALVGTFADPGAGGTHAAVVDWGDGTASAAAVDEASGTVVGSHVYADDGAYTVTLTVGDGDGVSGSDTTTATVANVAPTLTVAGAPGVDEGAPYAVSVSSSDPGADAVVVWTIDWGDGTVEPVAGTPSTATHVYADGSYGYTIAAVGTDDDGTYAATPLAVSVFNLAPAVYAGPDASLPKKEVPFAQAGSFADPGAESWTGTVDYGDGSGVQPLALYPDGGFALSHGYGNSGTFIVRVTVADGDGGVGSDTVVVTVK